MILTLTGGQGFRELGELERTAGCCAAQKGRKKRVIQNKLPGHQPIPQEQVHSLEKQRNKQARHDPPADSKAQPAQIGQSFPVI